MEQENNCFKHVFQKNIVQYIKQQHISEATKKEINLKEWMTENLELIRELERVVEYPFTCNTPETNFEIQEFPTTEEKKDSGKVTFSEIKITTTKIAKEIGKLNAELNNLKHIRKQQELLMDSNCKILALQKLNPLLSLDTNSFTTKKMIDDKIEHKFGISEENDEIYITPISCNISELKEEMIFEKTRMREFILYLIKTIKKNV